MHCYIALFPIYVSPSYLQRRNTWEGMVHKVIYPNTSRLEGCLGNWNVRKVKQPMGESLGMKLLTGHVTFTCWSCDLYLVVMWPLLAGHVTSTYWSCDRYSLVMWPLLTGHVNSTHWSCDLYLLVMWPLLTGHVNSTCWSCELHLLVMWTLLTGHVTSTYWSCDLWMLRCSISAHLMEGW